MTADELHEVLKEWRLNAAQAAKVLCLHTNKLSEYLGGVTRISCATEFHIEALQQVPEPERRLLFERRIHRAPHERPAPARHA